MQLFTLEDKSKVEIRIGAAHSGCNIKSTSSSRGLKALDHTTEFANEQLPAVAEREQSWWLCFSLQPFPRAEEKHSSEFWNCFKAGAAGKWIPKAAARSSCLRLVCRGNRSWEFCAALFLCKPQEPPHPCLFAYIQPN